LVTTGPCAGLAIGVYRESAGIHPAVVAVTPAGAVLKLGGGQLLRLNAGGPCVDRLSYVQRTGPFEDWVNEPRSLHDGTAGVVAEGSPQNQTGVVQFFLDCKGLVCSGSGAPLATLTIHVPGTAPGAASLTFDPVPTPIPLPTGEVVTIPSVLGMTPEAALRALQSAGLGEVSGNAMGSTGTVTSQDPPAGSVVLKGSGDRIDVSGAQPFTPPSGPSAPTRGGRPSAPASAAPPS
jgi:hypothetical protein